MTPCPNRVIMLLTSVRTSAERLGSSSPRTVGRRERFPDGSLVLARCRVVAGAAGLDDTRSRAYRTEVTVMWTGAERARLAGNAPGADTPGACGVWA